MSKVYCFILLVFILEFIFEFYYFTDSIFCIILYLFCSFTFIMYKRKASILCPESLFFLLSFIIFFYKEIVIDNVDSISALFTQFTDKQYLRGRCLNMIAFFSFLLGASIYSSKQFDNTTVLYVKNQIDIGKMSRTFPYFSACFLLLSIVTGNISLQSHYASSGTEFSNTFIVFYTILLVVYTVIEFIRLSNIGVSDFTSFRRKVNRVYIFQAIFFIALLLNVGYRSGAILTVLPIILCYSLMVSKISAKWFLVILSSGILCMVFIGFIRSGDDISGSNLTFYDSFRDFGPAYLTNAGLITYTDTHGVLGVGMGLRSLFSSIPFLGGIINAVFPSGYSVDDQSAVLATKLFQDRNNLGSGLGTSLVGDLYYSGHLLWVIVYMFVLGKLFANCYRQIFVLRRIGIYTLIFYVWMFSYSVFLTRAEWYSYFRYIGFSWVILYISNFIYNKRLIH